MQITKLTKRILDNQINCCELINAPIKNIEIIKTDSYHDSITLKVHVDDMNGYLITKYHDEVQSEYMKKEYPKQYSCVFTLEEIEPALLDDIILTDEEKQIIKSLIKKYNFKRLCKYRSWRDDGVYIGLLIHDEKVTIDSINIPNDIEFKFEKGMFKGMLYKDYERKDFNFLEEQKDENN